MLSKLKNVFISDQNRDREDRQNKADERNLTSEEANRLRGQAVAITFDDISMCINVSSVFIFMTWLSYDANAFCLALLRESI